MPKRAVPRGKEFHRSAVTYLSPEICPGLVGCSRLRIYISGPDPGTPILRRSASSLSFLLVIMATKRAPQPLTQDASLEDSSCEQAIQEALTDTTINGRITPICSPSSTPTLRHNNLPCEELPSQRMEVAASSVSDIVCTVMNRDGDPDPAERQAVDTIFEEPCTREPCSTVEKVRRDEGEESRGGPPVYLGTAPMQMWMMGRYAQELL